MVASLLYGKRFRKHYQQRLSHNAPLNHRFRERIMLFRDNPSHPLLRDHQLKGTQEGYRAFWITGDIRVVYQWIDDDTIKLLDIGTHNQVYR